MNIFKFFITNPRFPSVIAILMVLVGLIAIAVLPVSQYPQITPPQIVVSAVYPGANAEVLVDTVAVPIENQLNGVEGMLYMSSTATDSGIYTLTITFDIGINPDIAQVKVENRLEQVKSILPAIVIQEGLSVKTQSANILAFLALESPNKTYSNLYLSNFAYENIQNELARIDGVSEVNIFGPQNSIRVWLDVDKVASFGLNSEVVIKAIESQNIQASLGTLSSAPSPNKTNLVLNLTTKGLLSTVEDFEEIILSTDKNGGIVHLSDVAKIEIGADSYQTSANYNNNPSVVMSISQVPNSNALKIMNDLNQKIAQMQATFPEDMVFRTAYDSTTFVRDSIKGILETLALTFCLVVAIVYLFLQNWRATLIPTIAIPVSLIATFAVIYAFGFDINILTLFALILAIGLVVDDAIIVVERVQYLMKFKQMDSVSAAVQAMKDIASSIVATTFVLLSIFVPVALMAGITGKIYQQFAVTISTSIVLSAINALTLSPMLCAIFLAKDEKPLEWFAWFNNGLEKLEKLYANLVDFLCKNLKVTLLITAGVFFVVTVLFKSIPSSFVPEEDQGILIASVQLPDNSSINQTQSLLKYISTEALKMEGIAYFISISGTSMISATGENIGMAAIGLTPWGKRTSKNLSIEAITRKLSEKFSGIPGTQVEFFALPSIPGVGNASGLSFQLNAINKTTTSEELAKALEEMLIFVNTDKSFAYGFSSFSAQTPHIYLDIDRKKLVYYNINLASVFAALQNNLGSRYVNNITVDGQINKVIVQAGFDNRQDVVNVENLYVPSVSGKLVKLKDFVSFKTVLSPKIVYRFNQYTTASIIAQTAPGVSTGTTIEKLKEFMPKLGKKFDIAWTGLTMQEVETQGLAAILISLAIVFSYLFLVMLYESWLIACAVILTNVFAVLGALVGLHLMGLPFSIYAQLGVVLLIGLASKNAILIVSFTTQYQRSGMSINEAAVKGAEERYRAVLMTALTFILGVMPMIVAKGAGAASQIAIGTTVFFGMIVATVIGVVFVPAYFALFDKIALRGGKKK